MKKLNYKLESEIFRNSTLKELGVLRGFFLRVWVSKKIPRGQNPDALLAKTMVERVKNQWVECTCPLQG